MNPRDYSKYLGVHKTRYYMMLNIRLKTLDQTDLTQYSVNNVM